MYRTSGARSIRHAGSGVQRWLGDATDCSVPSLDIWLREVPSYPRPSYSGKTYDAAHLPHQAAFATLGRVGEVVECVRQEVRLSSHFNVIEDVLLLYFSLCNT